MSLLVFIRHGATKGNLEKRYIGRSDEELCDVGVLQMQNLKKYNFPKDHIFVSPMKRTIQSAEIIFPDSEYVMDDNFKEMNFGIFEGKSARELSKNEEYKKWVESSCTLPVPNGESVDAFKMRCIDAFKKTVTNLTDNSGASFVVHGGVIMAILEEFAYPKKDFYDYHIGNGEFLACKYQNGKIEVLEEFF